MDHSFLQDELEEVTLTEEEILDLAENYIVHKKYFENFHEHDESDSQSSEENACKSESAPPTTQSPLRAQSEVDQVCEVTLLHRDDGAVTLPTMSEIAQKSPTSWNGSKAKSVYAAFKLKPYIVDPNYLLCATQGHPHPTLMLTMDYLLGIIGHTGDPSLEFPKWIDIEEDILEVVHVFEGHEGLANALDKPTVAKHLIRDFELRIKIAKMDACKFRKLQNFKKQFFDNLQIACSDLKLAFDKVETNKAPSSDTDESRLGKSKEPKSISKSLSEKYLFSLVMYFTAITGIPLMPMPKSKIRLDISSHREERELQCEPDCQIWLSTERILVGKVKQFGCPGPYSTTHKGRRVIDEKSSQNACETGKEEPNRGDSTPGSGVAKKATYEERSGESSKASVSEQSSDNSEKQTQISFQQMPRHYRHLEVEEEYKLRSFLPQLMAEMLACRNASGNLFLIGRFNENVQMGFAMEGYKLRFVRMVLRDAYNTGCPTVRDLVNKMGVKCDMYLTQELNLFKRNHLIMFFQILLAISFCCHNFREPVKNAYRCKAS